MSVLGLSEVEVLILSFELSTNLQEDYETVMGFLNGTLPHQERLGSVKKEPAEGSMKEEPAQVPIVLDLPPGLADMSPAQKKAGAILSESARLSQPHVREMIRNQINFLQALLDETAEDDGPKEPVGMVLCLVYLVV
eukprot:s2845_g8.t1